MQPGYQEEINDSSMNNHANKVSRGHTSKCGVAAHFDEDDEKYFMFVIAVSCMIVLLFFGIF